MSGTSLDGVDGVLAAFAPTARIRPRWPRRIAPFPATLRAELMALQAPGDNEIHREALAANALARLYAACVATLLEQAGAAGAVRAVGVHGQTIRHRPELGYTRQTNNPALLAELTGIDVIADFRSRDIAAGGQGAPLVPAFHAAHVRRAGRRRAWWSISAASPISACCAATARVHRLRHRSGQCADGLLDRAPSRPALTTTTAPGPPADGRLRRCCRPCWTNPIWRCRRPRAPDATCSMPMAGRPAGAASARCSPADVQATLRALHGGDAGRGHPSRMRRRRMRSTCAAAAPTIRQLMRRAARARWRKCSSRRGRRQPMRWAWRRSMWKRWRLPGWRSVSTPASPATCRR